MFAVASVYHKPPSLRVLLNEALRRISRCSLWGGEGDCGLNRRPLRHRPDVKIVWLEYCARMPFLRDGRRVGRSGHRGHALSQESQQAKGEQSPQVRCTGEQPRFKEGGRARQVEGKDGEKGQGRGGKRQEKQVVRFNKAVLVLA